MKVTHGPLQGLLILEPRVFRDDRGFFYESYNEPRYKEAGLDLHFTQDNFSFSKKGVLRGLHFQNPNAQGKLVSVLHGEVFDVAVDVRVGSPTFGKWFGLLLSEQNQKQFYVPPGFAHGFLTTSETALFSYKCTDTYHPSSEVSIIWNDPEIGIEWPLSNALLSPKDAQAPRLRDLPADKLFKYS